MLDGPQIAAYVIFLASDVAFAFGQIPGRKIDGPVGWPSLAPC